MNLSLPSSMLFFGKEKACFLCFCPYVSLFGTGYFVVKRPRSRRSVNIDESRSSCMNVKKLAIFSIAVFVETVRVTKCVS